MKKAAILLSMFGSGLAAYGFSSWQLTTQSASVIQRGFGDSGPNWDVWAGWTSTNQLEITIGVVLLVLSRHIPPYPATSRHSGSDLRKVHTSDFVLAQLSMNYTGATRFRVRAAFRRLHPTQNGRRTIAHHRAEDPLLWNARSFDQFAQ